MFLPRAGFAALLGVPVVLGALEWARLCMPGKARQVLFALAVVLPAGVLTVLVEHSWAIPVQGALFAAASAFWCVVAPVWLAFGVNSRHRGALMVSGVLVLTSAPLALLLLPPGLALFVLGIAWVADSGAYFAGRAFGRRRLAPTISPGKTVEGALGGLSCVLVYAIICGMSVPMLPQRLAAGHWALFLAGSVGLAVLSVYGDLFESALKRQAGAKDSGTLLPGHGGILDRIDSLVAVLPVAALAVHLIGSTA